MANEFTHAAAESDLRMADLLAGEVQTLLADTYSLRDVPGALTYLGSINGRGSDTIRVPYAQIDALSATANEITAVANTAVTDSSFTCAVVRNALAREVSDLAGMTARGPGDIGLSRLASLMVGGARMAFMDAVAAAVQGFSATAGGTGVNLSVDNWYTAVATLEVASNEGPFFALLHPQQWADLQTSIRSETGAVEHRPDHIGSADIRGQGYAGSFLGVDIYLSSRVDAVNTASDRNGAMWSQGALAFADGTPVPVPGAIMSAPDRQLTIEIQRPDRSATSLVIGHSYFGVSLAEDARGVGIITDA